MSIAYTLAEVDAVAATIADLLLPGDAIGLSGGLGAGKTTLARGILQHLGLAGEAPSPSFAIVQPYAPPDVRLPLWHVDLYRLARTEELEELGLDEARREAALLIEWPELIAPHWPDMLHIAISGEGDSRRLTARVPPAWETRWTLF